MYLNEAKTHLSTLLKETIPVFMWGPPGIGKSSIIKQVCKEKNWQLIDLRLSLLNPVDLRGLPYIGKDQETAIWLKPEFLPTENNGFKKEGILFLDELNTAPTSVQIAAYQLLLDRHIGNYKFPDKWRIIAAGNRETDKAAVTSMPSPLANRLIHMHVDANIEDWKKWAVGKIDERIIAFLNYRPKLLSHLPKEEIKSYPTPRSWEFVSRTIKNFPDLDDAEQIIDGTVGEGPCKEFYAFLGIYKDLPNIEGILAGKINKVPKKTDVLYALVGALTARLSDDNLENFMKYVIRLQPEFSTLAVRDAARTGWAEKIEESKYWSKWSNKFGNYLD